MFPVAQSAFKTNSRQGMEKDGKTFQGKLNQSNSSLVSVSSTSTTAEGEVSQFCIASMVRYVRCRQEFLSAVSHLCLLYCKGNAFRGEFWEHS